jgi:hypothetical protein
MKGQAGHFIKACEADGTDVREVLFDICKYWKRFCNGELKYDNGKNIVLGQVVSFKKFYKYHDTILGYLKGHKSEMDAEYARDEVNRKVYARARKERIKL